MWGVAQCVVPRLGIKGAFGVARSSRLASLALDTEPLAAPGRDKNGGTGRKDAPPPVFARHPEMITGCRSGGT